MSADNSGGKDVFGDVTCALDEDGSAEVFDGFFIDGFSLGSEFGSQVAVGQSRNLPALILVFLQPHSSDVLHPPPLLGGSMAPFALLVLCAFDAATFPTGIHDCLLLYAAHCLSLASA
jgi:hypothetical protein